MTTARVRGDHVDPDGLRHWLDAVESVGSDQDLETVLHRVVEAAVALVEARWGALGVLDEAGEGIDELITVGLDAETRRALGRSPKELAESCRVVPVKMRDEVLGNLYLMDDGAEGAFSDVDEELIIGLASTAAVAIANARLIGRIRRREATLAAMQEVATALLAGVGPADSLQLVAGRARELVGADLATVVLPTADPGRLAVEIADGPFGAKFLGHQFPRVDSVSGLVMETAETVVVSDASSDYRAIQPEVGAPDIGPGVWVPLIYEGKPFGTLAAARPMGATPFSALELEVMSSFATQASVIMAHNRARQSLARVAMLEEEQERVANDLQDSIVQRLFATGLSIQGIARRAADPAIAGRLATAADDLDVTVCQIRAVIFELEAILASRNEGVRSRALEVTAQAARLLGFRPRVIFTGPLDSVISDWESDALLATLSEALSNVARHARARHVDVGIDLSVAERIVRVRVHDDGIGIDRTATSKGGRGLDAMSARAEDNGGGLSIEAAPGGGTLLTWHIPVSIA